MILRHALPFVVLLSVLICPLAVTAQEAKPSTIWSYLGIPEGMKKAHAKLFNRKGKFPKLEPKPPVLAIADPANLDPSMAELGGGGEAIQIAAKVKQAEDAAPQKIKAVRYLAKIGCGCYDEVGVTDALVKAMGDATKSVRLATIEAISDAAENGECESCHESSCCNEKIITKLAERAYDIDETGCFVEVSEEVREAAADALEACCPSEGYPEVLAPDALPEREREAADAPNATEARFAPTPAEFSASPRVAPLPPGSVSSRRQYQAQPNNWDLPPVPTNLTSVTQGGARQVEKQLPRVLEKMEGIVQRVDAAARLVYLEFPSNRKAGADSKIEVFHNFLLGSELTGKFTIVRSSPGFAVARLAIETRRGHVARGDVVVGWGERLDRNEVGN